MMSAHTDRTGNDLIRVLRTLAAHEVDFVICGGVACVLHGVSRVTQDIDIALRMSDANLRRFVAAVHELEATPRMPEPIDAIADPDRRRAWIEDKGARVITLNLAASPFQVDVFLQYPISYDELSTDAIRMEMQDIEVRISSVAHLIKAKQAVTPRRTIDQRDIDDLKELLKRDQTER